MNLTDKETLGSSRGSPFPSKWHLVLIKACLLEGEDARLAWEDWKANTDFESEVDGPAFRLLPLLYLKLLQLGIQDSKVGRLKGIYRQSWSNNHLLFLRAGQIIKVLNDANIPNIVLKGIALTVSAYNNFGARPMSDIDILIKRDHVRLALKRLFAAGFSVNDGQSLEYVMRYGNSISLTGPSAVELDLHWNPIIESNNVEVNHDWWKEAVSLEVSGQSTLALSTENMLLHTLVHGIRYNPEPPIRWIPDTAVLLNKNIDWNLFTRGSIDLRAGFLTMRGLSYLKRNFGLEIPDVVIRDLRSRGFTLTERLAFRYAVSPKTIPPRSWSEKLLSNYFFYLRQTRFTNPLLQIAGFMKYSFFSLRSKSHLVDRAHDLYARLYLRDTQ